MPFKTTIFIFCIVFYKTTQAQNETKIALNILDKVRTYYQSLNTFKANYIYTIECLDQESIQKKKWHTGDITVRGEQYRIFQTGDEIINDGETVWTYTKYFNELTISNYNPDDTDINPAKVYMLYQQGYMPIHHEWGKNKKNIYDVIVLVPTTETNPIVKIILEIEHTTYQIHRWTMIDHENIKTTYVIKKLHENIQVPEDYFSFDKKKYPNLEVMDLREEEEDLGIAKNTNENKG